MSTSVLYPNAAATWKQEVHRSLAAHRNRRGLLVAQPAEPAPRWAVSSGRGSLVAARVAARYAHAPSYSQLQSVEAPVAARVAAVAPQTALEPRVEARAAKAPSATAAVLQTALPAARSWEPPLTSAALPDLPEKTRIPAPVLLPIAPVQASAPPPPPESLDAWESAYAHNGWRPDPRLRPLVSDVVRSPRPALMDQFFGAQGPVAVEPDLPIHANLIEFPREVVAARKMRPRRAEKIAAEETDRQLSIFEVDPGAFALPSQAEPAPAAIPHTEWSGIKLEAQPPVEARRDERSVAEAEVHLAPIGHRLMSVLVDGALITAIFVALSIVAAANAGTLPTTKAVAFAAASILLLLCLLYQTIFLLLAGTTPGMRYAGISLCTFDGQIPAPAELRSRLGALLLSVAPIGLGVAWALFDEDHLCWHDRLSGTYLRKE